MGDKRAPLDWEIERIARTQHGVVTHRQLLELGISRNAVSARARRGVLHRLHRGVYAVGHTAISPEGRWIAAVLACGAGAVLSCRSAAVLWGLLRPWQGPVDVSVPGRGGRSGHAGIRLHRPRSLVWDETVMRLGIPVTTAARTVADLRAVCPAWEVRRTTRQAEFLKLPLGPIETDGSRSDLETDFLALCRRFRIPDPEVNVRVGRWTIDFLWRAERVAVETDFYDYHRGRVAFRDDRARDLGLRRLAFAVRRYSEEQVNEQPGEVAADLREALGLDP
jgi:very-short-patch-repair endonuclease